ncbi:hypothetical protein OC846_002057 [Tilletia horrida]|uniref:Uncharacterized protein n=1 Tax=Tilletia horrida TaxID=155126 RepID=A0AAN6GVB6_9BASI|nr:hypothetical protein OC846_002057 [Tilletia horrida]KAK0568269.1 hypothetical protein OC861_002133 [Tilletia horrida]
MSTSVLNLPRPMGPRAVRSSGTLGVSNHQDNAENDAEVSTRGMPQTYHPHKRSAGLPPSRSWPLALASHVDEAVTVKEAKMASWHQYRSPAHSASCSSSSVKTSSDSSGSSCYAGSEAAPSPWHVASNLSSPRFEDSERLEPPSPWEQLTPDTSFMNSTNPGSSLHDRTPPSFQRPTSYQAAVEYMLDESLSLASAANASPATSLLPAATLRAPSMNAGAPIVPLDPSEPGQPSYAGKPRRIPLAEIPLWYADARGEYLRRVKQERRSGLCNVMSPGQAMTQQHILSTNTSHNIPTSEGFPSLAEMTSSSSQSFYMDNNIMTQGTMFEMSSSMAVCDEGVERLFVLADEPRTTAPQSPARKAKSKVQRRKSGLVESGGSTPLRKLCSSRPGR